MAIVIIEARDDGGQEKILEGGAGGRDMLMNLRMIL